MELKKLSEKIKDSLDEKKKKGSELIAESTDHKEKIAELQNAVLEKVERNKEEVKELVPHYVFKTQSQFRQCPACKRIYWRGTHWRAMTRRLEKFRESD